MAGKRTKRPPTRVGMPDALSTLVQQFKANAANGQYDHCVIVGTKMVKR